MEHENPIDLHKIPAISDIMAEVAGVICDSYCKFPELYKDKTDDELWRECCNDCPFHAVAG